MVETHQKLAIIRAFSLVFNEIALHPIDSPLPLFNVEYVRLSDRCCGRNNIEKGRGVKENKDVRDRKSSLISTASQLFLHGIEGIEFSPKTEK